MNIKEKYLTADDKDLLIVCLRSDNHPYTSEMGELLNKISDIIIELSLNWFSEIFGKELIDNFCKSNKTVINTTHKILSPSFKGVKTVNLFWDDEKPKYPSKKFGILEPDDVQKYYLCEDEIYDRSSTISPILVADKLPDIYSLLCIAEKKGFDEETIENIRRFNTTIPLGLILKDPDQEYVLLEMMNRYTHCSWVLRNSYRSYEVYNDNQFLKDIKSWEELKNKYPEWHDLLIEAKKQEKEREALNETSSTLNKDDRYKYNSKVEKERKMLLDFSEKSLESILLELKYRLQDLDFMIPDEKEE